MLDVLKFIFSDFKVFIGIFMMLFLCLSFLAFVLNRSLRHFNIRKLGYPPSHCDADGDFREEK